MAFYEIPLTILATIKVRARDRFTAAGLAVRYVDGALESLPGGFLDGWNDARQPGDGYVDDFTGGDIEGMHRLADEAIEIEGPTWAVEPQRDLNAGVAGADGTRFEACEESEATQFALFETNDGESTLVEDYPTREAAEAAAEALRNGDPLPTPIWPETPPTVESLIADGLDMLEAVEYTEADPENGRVKVILADGRVLTITATVEG